MITPYDPYKRKENVAVAISYIQKMTDGQKHSFFNHLNLFEDHDYTGLSISLIEAGAIDGNKFFEFAKYTLPSKTPQEQGEAGEILLEAYIACFGAIAIY